MLLVHFGQGVEVNRARVLEGLVHAVSEELPPRGLVELVHAELGEVGLLHSAGAVHVVGQLGARHDLQAHLAHHGVVRPGQLVMAKALPATSRHPCLQVMVGDDDVVVRVPALAVIVRHDHARRAGRDPPCEPVARLRDERELLGVARVDLLLREGLDDRERLVLAPGAPRHCLHLLDSVHRRGEVGELTRRTRA